jgi:hypothetical protein
MFLEDGHETVHFFACNFKYEQGKLILCLGNGFTIGML